LIVTLDEPEDRVGIEPRRTAGYTAVPVAAEIIRRVAPLLGIAPNFRETKKNAVKLAAN
jgi:cell division protein FtsI (penicillin-binding protein 3)